jgi:replicative DNA helicase
VDDGARTAVVELGRGTAVAPVGLSRVPSEEVGVSERVVELPSQGRSSAPEFERTPPQDIAAEQSVLGGMLLSKDAIADVVEVVRANDFYKPAHQTIFDVVVDLYGKGEPADPITVSAELTRLGEIGRVGGAPYLHTLLSSVPTAANAGFYARIVAEQAILRRLVEAGTRIVQLGYGASGSGGVDDTVDRAQQAIYDVTERRSSEDYTLLEQLMQPTMDELEAIGSRGGSMSGVPTGFVDLDGLTNGLHPGQLIVIAGRPGLGKALALDTALPTPTGWTTMGEVSVGTQLLDAAGRPTRVVAVSDVLRGRPCYELAFSDGTRVVADAEHQWLTSTRASRRAGEGPAVRTTAEIAATVHGDTAGGGAEHAVATTEPLQLPEADLLLSPYVLGAWLGAGDAAQERRATDPELLLQLEVEGVEDAAVQERLQALGVLGDEHVPPAYLRASQAQRRALLAGLMDSDGTVTAEGGLRLAVTSERLARGIHELVVGLGHLCTVTRTVRSGRAPSWTVAWATDERVFRLERKHLQHKRLTPAVDRRLGHRQIVSVVPVPSVPVRCVEVDNAEHLYLATRSMVPTHNSTLGLDIARAASVKSGLPSAIFSLEMSKTEITMRLLSAEARVPLHHMRSGTMTDDDWNRLAKRMGEVAEAPLYIDDSPNLTMMEIRAKARRLRQRNDLRLIVIDYLQLMSGNKKAESRQQEVSELSRSLKLLAKELEVPVIAMSQLNRGAEQRTDKKPQIADLRESGCLPASTRVVRADTGSEVTLGELFTSGAQDVPVWSLDSSLRYIRRHLTHVFSTGRRPVFELVLASGKRVTATGNHPFLTYDGWRPLAELSTGSRIAVPRHLPAPDAETAWPEGHVVLLAHLLGDGSFVKGQPLRYASVDEANLAAVTEGARAFGITAVRDDHPAARCTSLRLPAPFHLTPGRRNPVAEWLEELGLFGRRPHEKFVPPAVSRLPKAQIRLFLRHLWATDGSVTVTKGGGSGRIYYNSASRELCDGVSRLLLRFGISTRLRAVTSGEHGQQWTLDISGVDEQRRFLQEIGVHGQRGQHAAALEAAIADVRANANVDTVPREVWQHVRQVLTEKKVSARHSTALGTSHCGSAMWKPAPSRERLGRVAAVLDDEDLELLATNDVFWDEVVTVESRGEQEVFDATVLGTHNFVADGVAVHNSIEQDADMVILLHREDAYEKESPRAGEADFIVAKHRNGPTATITVAFQGHYSRFVDMNPA